MDIKCRIAALGALIVLTCSCSLFSGEAEPEFASEDTNLQTGVLNIRFSEETVSRLEASLSKGPSSQTGDTELDAVLDALGAERIERLFPYDPRFEERQRREGLHRYYKVSYDPAASTASKAAGDLSSVRGVESVSAPHRKRLTAIPFNDPLAGNQWNLFNDGSLSNLFAADADIDVVRVWDKFTAGSKTVTVAVVDGGFDMSHPDLAAVSIPYGDEGSNDFVYGKSIVPDKHGTHVAGIIGAINNNGEYVSSVAGGNDGTGGVRLLSCQIFVGDKFGDSPSAIVWACNHGALICNNSWGYDYNSQTAVNMSDIDEADKAAIDYFIRYAGCDNDGNQLPDSPMKGGVVVFASGNQSFYDAYPSAYPPVISVSALAPDNNLAYYSNYGASVDISAPGGDVNLTSSTLSAVLSTSPVSESYAGEGNAYTCSLQGTSMACPHVSGVAALLVSYFGGEGFTNDMLVEKLLGGANPLVTANSTKTIGPALDAFGSFVYGEDYLSSDIPIDLSVSGANVTVSTLLPDNAFGCHLAISPDVNLFEAIDWDAFIAGDDSSVPGQVTMLSYKGQPGDSPIFTAKLENNKAYSICGVLYDRNRRSGVSSPFDFQTYGNHAPVVSGTTSAIVDSLGRSSAFCLGDYISDPDLDVLEYEVKADNENIASFEVKGDSLVVTSLAYGRTNVTLTARDPYEESAQCNFLLVSRDGERGADLYPMPFSDVLNIAVAKEGTHSYVIFSSKGRMVSGSIVSSLDNPASLDLSMLPPGVYTLVLDNDSANSYKIVKI